LVVTFLADAWPITPLERSSWTKRSTLQTSQSSRVKACHCDLQGGGW
jgi:hypothetical protein